MISLETTLIFAGIVLPLYFIPTPEMVMVISQSSAQGRIAGIAITCGICTAALCQVLAAAFGITAILQTSATLFIALKVIGVSYLLFLAWQVYRQPVLGLSQAPTNQGLLVNYRRGLLVSISNPFNALFAFLFLCFGKI